VEPTSAYLTLESGFDRRFGAWNSEIVVDHQWRSPSSVKIRNSFSKKGTLLQSRLFTIIPPLAV
jgi:hypothetical protein